MPVGKIFMLMATLALIGLCAAAVVGAAIVIVPVIALCLIGWLVYKWTRTRPRYRPNLK